MGEVEKLYEVEPVSVDKYLLGEGPYYDPRYKRLSWIDIIGKALWIMDKDGGKKKINLPQRAGAAIPLSDSEGFLLCMEDGLYKYEEEIVLLTDLKKTYKPYWRSNDAKADPMGRIFFGAMVADDEHNAEGNLYVLNKGEVQIVVSGTGISNGMAWSSDGKKFFFSDSVEHTVSVFDYDISSGMIVNRKVLFKVENGTCDGLTIDSEDNLWVAVWDGSRVEKRSALTGKLLKTIDVPAKHVSSCCFGDEDMKSLYITSSGDGLDGKYDGCLFKCRTDVKGVTPDYA